MSKLLLLSVLASAVLTLAGAALGADLPEACNSYKAAVTGGPLPPDDGLGLYSYRYLWSDTIYVGVMAQEVALIRPDAIVRGGLDDYLRVDYSRLGLKLMMLPEWDAPAKGERL
jgi:hypothetical protein